MNPEVFDALSDLVDCCQNMSGQSYKVRALLYSLWNGKPTSLLEVVSLDSSLRLKLALVICAFGSRGFFYDEIKAAFVRRGLFDWFVEQGEVK